MRLIFLDESGYSKNWKEDIETQPFHVLACFQVDADVYINASERLRSQVKNIGLEKIEHPLGLGFEIKANEIAKGKGWWKHHNDERNALRELMLSFPLECKGTTFLVVVDKKRHASKYVFPDPPHEKAFQFMFERLQWFLRDQNDFAVCVYDQTKFLDDDLHNASMGLMRDGSPVSYWSEYYGHVSEKFAIDRVKEFYLGRSENSLGIQIADYFATFGYQYFKSGCPDTCSWWDTIAKSLYEKEGKRDGFGLKVFP